MSFAPLPILTRHDAATAVLAAELRLGPSWATIARTVGRSTEWSTSALLGQQPVTAEQAEAVDALRSTSSWPWSGCPTPRATGSS